MGEYKLIALDMDGTLLTEEKTISEENRQAILEAVESGVTVMFATGRGIQSAYPYVEELGLTSPIVTVNGGEVWSRPGELHRRRPLDTELVFRLRELALQYDSWYWSYSVNGVFNKERWLDDQAANEQTWLKFGYYTEDTGILAAIRKELESWDRFELTNSHPFNIELNPKGVSKASGLHDVCAMLGITMSQAIAMGDSLNDIAMIREAGLGVAMGNAQDEVKRIADIVTDGNEEHGVAKVIREYVLS